MLPLENGQCTRHTPAGTFSFLSYAVVVGGTWGRLLFAAKQVLLLCESGV